MSIPGPIYDSVVNDLTGQGSDQRQEKFRMAGRKEEVSRLIFIPAGTVITANMSNNDLINMLRSGKQEPVMVTFNNLRTLDELASVVAGQLEPDSAAFANCFHDPETAEKSGFTHENFPVMFIPDSYEFYWNNTPEEFVKRMKSEYVAFWSEGQRKQKADNEGLKPAEVSILASIVEQESLHSDENPLIAGVFINRLEKGIPLQSDPTLIFAFHDFQHPPGAE